jgi:hypothetical protein
LQMGLGAFAAGDPLQNGALGGAGEDFPVMSRPWRGIGAARRGLRSKSDYSCGRSGLWMFLSRSACLRSRGWL